MNNKLFNSNKNNNERKYENDPEYIEVFDYLLFGVLPLSPWFISRCTTLAEHLVRRRTYLVRRDSLPYLPKPQVLSDKTKGVNDEKEV